MNYSKIGSIEAICLIVIAVLNQLILNLPKNLLDSCGSSTPLNIIFVSILVFIFLYFVIKLFKNFSNSDILDVSEFLGGKILKTIIGILFICYFIVLCSTQLRNFCEILKIVYFPKASIGFLIAIFLLVGIIASKFGFGTIIKSNLIVVPIVMINLLIAFFWVSARFVPERIFPILGYGVSETFFSGMTNIFAFTGLSYIYFLQPMLHEKEKFKTISFIGIGISTLFVLLSVTSLLFSFSDILVINELSPVYLLIRGADFGRFFQRPDAIFFLGWILCFMSYVSITIFFITNIARKIGNLHSRFPLTYALSTLLFIVAIIFKDITQIRFIQDNVFKYFTIILVFVISFLILVFANIKHRKTHKLQPKESDFINE